jgi:predicted MFS family arabinose efflux permease
MGEIVELISEGRLLFLLGAVQFINVVDFMMVLPMGPDFAVGLGISTARLGLVAGAYTAAAAVAGLIGALFLDRFDRRSALFVAMAGLVLGTAAGGFAQGLGSMLAARALAGFFGGPATAMSLAILADAIPPARRGQALGKVAGAFAVASVVGVPIGMRLSLMGGWRLPFFAIAGLGLVVALTAIAMMPPMRKHLTSGVGGRPVAPRSLGAFVRDPTVLASLGCTAALMMGTFALVSNLSTFLQFNLGYPRERLELLYMVGGLLSFFAMRLAGRWVDRRGPIWVAMLGTALSFLAVSGLFVLPRPPLPIIVLFAGMMMSNAIRVVTLNATSSRVPDPRERARFMSAQSAVQHISTAIGAMASVSLLHERADHSLVGMPRLAAVALGLAALLPLLLSKVIADVRRREAAAVVAVATPAAS